MINIASLVNLLGFAVGIALYGLLLVMVVRHRSAVKNKISVDLLLLATAVLGLLWNFVKFVFYIWKDFSPVPFSPFWLAVSYTALGFLPSLVVHSIWKNEEKEDSNLRYLTFFAYGLSFIAGILHFYSAIFQDTSPSRAGLLILTLGSLALLGGLLVLAIRGTLERKAVWISALLVLALSALHLSAHTTEEFSWPIELATHQSSLPLVLAILLQDYRFAFADLFLKRALSLLLLAFLAFGLYFIAADPLLVWHENHEPDDVHSAAIVLTFGMTTALFYPFLHKLAVWFVDTVILGRSDFEKLKTDLSKNLEKLETVEEVLRETCQQIKTALTAGKADWQTIKTKESNLPSISFNQRRAEIFVPTTETPSFLLILQNLDGGRKLLSDEILMLEAVSLLAARRIDALRVTHERCELEIREQEFAKLATEAQLSALRAQINPHFLFNALTTIGYLIQTAPDKAFETLLRLTRLLRSVLNSTDEFSTLGEEINLIKNYLDIEKARFEERLTVKIDVPKELETLKIPALLIQPLVENAIKHGVSENKNGGEVCISTILKKGKKEEFLSLKVIDSGSGRKDSDFENPNGIGLKNIRERLQSYYGDQAQLTIQKSAREMTEAEIVLPVKTRF